MHQYRLRMSQRYIPMIHTTSFRIGCQSLNDTHNDITPIHTTNDTHNDTRHDTRNDTRNDTLGAPCICVRESQITCISPPLVATFSWILGIIKTVQAVPRPLVSCSRPTELALQAKRRSWPKHCGMASLMSMNTKPKCLPHATADRQRGRASSRQRQRRCCRALGRL